MPIMWNHDPMIMMILMVVAAAVASVSIGLVSWSIMLLLLNWDEGVVLLMIWTYGPVQSIFSVEFVGQPNFGDASYRVLDHCMKAM